MKKEYFTFATLMLLSIAAVAQERAFLSGTRLNTAKPVSVDSNNNQNLRGGATVYWQDNFDVPGNWTINNGTQSDPYGWGIRSTSEGWWSANGINSSSDGNFAELANGDPTLTPGTQAVGVTYTLTTAAAIDVQTLAGTHQVLLEFEQFGARFYDAQTIEVSTNGTNFTIVGDNFDFPQLTSTGGSPYPNPDTKVIDISSYIEGNASSVWLRFSWTSDFPNETNPNAWVAYGWYIDDVRIVAKEQHDMVLDYGYISHNSSSLEYGRVPRTQLYEEMLIGGSAINFGSSDETNLSLNISVLDPSQNEVFSSQATQDLLEVNDTAFLELFAQSSLFASPGRYRVNFSVESDDETSSSGTFSDNEVSRRFEVTDTLYSLDGIGGVHLTSSPLEYLGNASFSENVDDDFMVLTYYELVEEAEVTGVQVLLAPGTEAGSSFFVAIYREEEVEADDVSGLPDEYWIQSELHDVSNNVTQGNMNNSNGSPKIYFEFPELLEPGGYYAAVRTVNSNVVNVRDDVTVPQPPGASLIFVPEDGNLYTNPNAAAVRLIIDAPITTGVNSVQEAGFDVAVYPNPAGGDQISLNVNSDRSSVAVVNVVAANGAVVLTRSLNVVSGLSTHQLDVAGLSNGLYFVQVNGEEGQITKKLMLNR